MAPSYLTVLPLTILSATMRACLLAGPARKLSHGRPVRGCGVSIASPTAYTPSADVWRYSSTYMPRISPSLIPAFSARCVSARTPIDSRTISAFSSIPVCSLTVSSSPSWAKASTACPRYSLTPFSTRCSWTRAAMEKSMGVITCGAISTTDTSAPACVRFSAISSPMNPPPTMTARLTFFCSIYALILSVSSTLRSVNIPSEPMPGRGGRTGDAPGERRRRSYRSVYSLPAVVLTLTVFACVSMAVTSLFTLTSILKRLPKASGVCTKSRSRSVITPPM